MLRCALEHPAPEIVAQVPPPPVQSHRPTPQPPFNLRTLGFSSDPLPRSVPFCIVRDGKLFGRSSRPNSRSMRSGTLSRSILAPSLTLALALSRSRSLSRARALFLSCSLSLLLALTHTRALSLALTFSLPCRCCVALSRCSPVLPSSFSLSWPWVYMRVCLVCCGVLRCLLRGVHTCVCVRAHARPPPLSCACVLCV